MSNKIFESGDRQWGDIQYECHDCGTAMNIKPPFCPVCESKDIRIFKKPSEILAELPKENSLEKIKSVPEIMAEPIIPINWIIKPFFRPSCISLIAAQTGQGKTWVALLAGLNAASKTPFLNKFETRQARILYLDYENFDLMNERLSMLVHGLGIEPSSFKEMDIFSTTKKFKEIYETLKRLIATNKYELLFIDTLRDFTEVDENDSTMVSMFVNELRKLAITTNCHICLLHHENKNQKAGDSLSKIRGSSAFAGAADNVLQLKCDNENLVFEHSKCRGARVTPSFYCNISQEEGKYYSLTYSGLAFELDGSKAIAFFSAWAIDNRIKTFSSTEFYDACSLAKISKSTAKRAITKLALEGKIRKESSKARAKWVVCEEMQPEPIKEIKIEAKK